MPLHGTLEAALAAAVDCHPALHAVVCLGQVEGEAAGFHVAVVEQSLQLDGGGLLAALGEHHDTPAGLLPAPLATAALRPFGAFGPFGALGSGRARRALGRLAED